jgi:hypothetical protein
MKKQPEGAATQEGEDDYSTYKAAGKVGRNFEAAGEVAKWVSVAR